MAGFGTKGQPHIFQPMSWAMWRLFPACPFPFILFPSALLPHGLLKVARRCRRIILTNFAGTLLVDGVGVGLAASGSQSGAGRDHSRLFRTGVYLEFGTLARRRAATHIAMSYSNSNLLHAGQVSAPLSYAALERTRLPSLTLRTSCNTAGA